VPKGRGPPRRVLGGQNADAASSRSRGPGCARTAAALARAGGETAKASGAQGAAGGRAPTSSDATFSPTAPMEDRTTPLVEDSSAASEGAPSVRSMRSFRSFLVDLGWDVDEIVRDRGSAARAAADATLRPRVTSVPRCEARAGGRSTWSEGQPRPNHMGWTKGACCARDDGGGSVPDDARSAAGAIRAWRWLGKLLW
jgi:hypothetical protein